MEPQAVPHRGLITGCAMLATLMQALDSTIANVALPYMQGSLSATSDQITWVLTSYVIAAAIMTAPVGWMAARYGRKRLFVVCLLGFTATSMPVVSSTWPFDVTPEVDRKHRLAVSWDNACSVRRPTSD